MQKNIILFALLMAGLALATGAAAAQDAGFSAPSSLKAEVAAPAARGAETFISVMAQKAIDYLSDAALTPEQRRREFKRLLDENFDMTTIGRFCLGRYWNVATHQQQSEYQALFRQMIVDVYSHRFEQYSGQRLDVRGSYEESGDTIVTSFVVPKNGGAEVEVDWRVRSRGGRYKIVDVVVEGVSMSVTQRSDFASVIQRGGGGVDALLDHLRTL